jgi:ketosteroid isomerase-like protein
MSAVGRDAVDARDRLVDRFFTATEQGDFETAASLTAPDCIFWQNVDEVDRPFRASLPRLGRIYERLGPWTYSHPRRAAAPLTVCHQHIVTFLSGSPLATAVPVCMVLSFDAARSLVRIDEYLDSAAVEGLLRRAPA